MPVARIEQQHMVAEAAAKSANWRWWALAGCCLATCARSLEPPFWVFQSPQVLAFNAGWAQYSLVIGLLTLGTLALLLLGGVLGDIFGRRRLLLGGLLALIAANLLAVISPTPSWIIGTRLLGGAAGALIVPLSLTMLYVSFSDDLRARTTAIAIYVIVTSSTGLGRGMLAQLMYLSFDWRATVVVPTLFAVLGLVLLWRTTQESAVPTSAHLDVIGHAAWSLTVFGVLFGLVIWQVAGPYTIVAQLSSLSAVICGIALLLWWDYRSPESLLGQSKIPRRALLILIVFGVCLQIGFIGLIGQVRNVLLAVYDYSVVQAGLGLVPLVLGMLVMTVWGVQRLVMVRPHVTMGASLLALGVLCALIALTRAAAWYPWLGLLLALVGAASVAASTAWTSVFFSLMPEEVIGVRTGINSSVSQVGSALGGAFTANLLVVFGLANLKLQLLAAGVDHERVNAALNALNTILDPTTPNPDLDATLSDRLLASYRLTYLAAYERVLWVVAAVCALGALVVWWGLPRSSRAAKHS